MKISWLFLSQILDLSFTTPKSLSNLLTTAGLEVDSLQFVESHGIKDIIFDIAPIPNRRDLCNVISVAHEVAIILQQKFCLRYFNTHFLKNENYRDEISHNIQFTSFNSLSVLMNNIKLSSSPKWVQSYIMLEGIKPTNTIIDIIQYIKLKWGQDIIVFDISQWYSVNQHNMIIVKDRIKTVNLTSKNYYQKSCSVVLINNHEVVCNIVDIKNIKTSVRTILIHAVIMDGYSVSNKVNNSTVKSQSHSLRVNLDKNVLFSAMQEVKFLYQQLCGGNVQDYKLSSNNFVHPLCVKVTKNNLLRILGPRNNKFYYISAWDKEVERILTLLDCALVQYSNYWLITVPKKRQHDLIREIDIIEEIARVYGFLYFNDVLPITYCRNRQISLQELLKKQTRLFLRNIGLYELLHSSLKKNQPIHIYNPLSDEYSGLRSNLSMGLIQSLYYNIYQSNDIMDGFEIGKVFYKKPGNTVLYERLHLGIIWGCKSYIRDQWSNKPSAMSWLQAKGMISNLCQSIGISVAWRKSPPDFNMQHLLHKKRSAILSYQKQIIGFFGEVNPKIYYNFNLTNRLYLCEFDLDSVIEKYINNNYAYNRVLTYSKYPCVIRDLSIIVPTDININFIINKTHSIKNPFVKSIDLFSQYLGKPIPVNRRSLSFRITYQAKDRTLTNTEVTQLHNNVKNTIISELNIDI